MLTPAISPISVRLAEGGSVLFLPVQVQERTYPLALGRQEKEVGMDMPGVRQVPEGSGEQRKVEETGCEVICGAPTSHVVKE